jgi:hypothetical protein
MQSGNLNFLEPTGPLLACNGTALPLPKENSKYEEWEERRKIKTRNKKRTTGCGIRKP